MADTMSRTWSNTNQALSPPITSACFSLSFHSCFLSMIPPVPTPQQQQQQMKSESKQATWQDAVSQTVLYWIGKNSPPQHSQLDNKIFCPEKHHLKTGLCTANPNDKNTHSARCKMLTWIVGIFCNTQANCPQQTQEISFVHTVGRETADPRN